jgi:hypothetical protein
MRRVALAAVLALLAGCVFGPSRQQVLQQFIGADEATLVAAMGVPTRTYTAGAVKFLAYDQQRTEVIAPPPSPWGWGYGWYSPFPPQVVTYGCETTFQIYQGRVASFTLRGNAC